MKHALLTFCVSFITLFVSAQIPDWNMEDWTTLSNSVPDQWSNNGNVSKVSGHSGSAVKLVTDVPNRNIGAVIYGRAQQNSLGGGIPFTATPDSISGYFEYDVQAGDTAFIVVSFQKNGFPISFDRFPITGSNTSSFVRLAFKINYLLPVSPDTVFIGITSGNPFSNTFKNSYVIADDLAFSAGSIPNGDFESWKTVSFDIPTGWASQNDFAVQPVQKTTDKYDGSYAIRIQNVASNVGGGDGVAMTVRSGGSVHNMSGPMPAFAVTSKPDSFFCWAKFAPQNGDTGTVMLQLFQHGTPVGFAQQFLTSTPNYTLLRMKINYNNGSVTPDSANIMLAAFRMSENSRPKGASVLTVDNLSFDHPVFSTGLRVATENAASYTVFPNPANNVLNLLCTDVQAVREIDIVDINGRIIMHCPPATQHMDISTLSPGIYCLSIKTANSTATQKFVKY